VVERVKIKTLLSPILEHLEDGAALFAEEVDLVDYNDRDVSGEGPVKVKRGHGQP
jgi:hypothetical protein